jgi:hypothetical protein
MLGMLRRARERREERERNCPCQQACPCHKPEPGVPFWTVPVFFVLFFGIIALCGPLPPAPKRYVRVGSKTCEVVFVKTGEEREDRLLHHESKDVGYDQAVCP